MKADSVSPAVLEQIRQLRGTIVASAIEKLRVRLPNVGFADCSIRAVFKDQRPIVGYAATLRIRTTEPPMEGRNYYKNTEWWGHVVKIREPRIVVVEDLDDPSGRGAFVGEAHACILKALGCIGLVTNGTVRDTDCIQTMGFPMFARGVSLSHAFAHVVDFGGKVTIAGLEVEPGELIHADRHGVQTIPLEIAAEVPRVAEAVMERRKRFLDLCSGNSPMEKLREAVEENEGYKK